MWPYAMTMATFLINRTQTTCLPDGDLPIEKFTGEKAIMKYKMDLKKAANGNTLTGGFMNMGFGGNWKLGH
jgi:hypothetical protein